MAKPERPVNDAKPHYFELVMNSYSEGVLNQEVVIVREYAATGAQLTAKQMSFTRDVTVPIAEAVVAAMDKMSKPYQEIGIQEMMDAVGGFGKKK